MSGRSDDHADQHTRRLDAPAGTPPPPGPAEPREFGDYLLLETLGRGGMGVVWRARQRSLDRDVAIKFVAGSDGGDRFRDEARHAARIQHPNIVEIYEFGQRDGQDYFSMRLIEGRSLAEQLRVDGPLPPREAARLLRIVAEAIDYAHRLGVLHLDLKPANILLTPAGEPLVADFGLARAVGAGERGEVAGSPGYMAPEQHARGVLDVRTDVYGLGAVLQRMLGGRRLGDDGHSLSGADADAAVLVSTRRRPVPADLEAICRRCLATDPARRYPTARELADDLQRFLEGRMVSARPLDPARRAWRWARREPALAAALAVAFVALSGGLGASLLQAQRAERARSAAEAARASADEQRRIAETRAERMRQSARFMAVVFPKEGEQTSSTGAAERAINWMSQEMPGDDDAQAELLTVFAQALVEADRFDVADVVLLMINERLDDDYREAVVAKLLRRPETLPWLRAAIVAKGYSSSLPRELSTKAVAAAPADPFAAYVAALYCNEILDTESCGEEYAHLRAVDPDNVVSWVISMNEKNLPPARQRELLAGAAAATHWNDHFGAMARETYLAFRDARLPVPRVLVEPRAAISQPQDLATTSVRLFEITLPLPPFWHLSERCTPTPQRPLPADVRADCLRAWEPAVDARISMVLNAHSWHAIRVLDPSREAELRERRRGYAWIWANDLAPVKLERAYPGERLLSDYELVGQLEAVVRRDVFYGIPRKPPAGWLPDDPTELMLPAERTAWLAAHPDADGD